MRERRGRRRGRSSQSVETRKLLVAAAARQFREKGYAATTLKEIGAVAGIEPASLYYYFASKEDILEEVLDFGFRQALDAVGAVHRKCEERGAGFRETFRAMIHAHLCCILIEGDFAAATMRNFSTMQGSLRLRHRPSFHAYGDLWETLLTTAQAAGDVRSDVELSLLQRLIVGALNWTVEWFDATGFPLRNFSDNAAGLLLDGMLDPSVSFDMDAKVPLMVEPVLDIDKSRAKAERTRSMIIFSASQILCEGGYDDTTLRRIAEKAGVEAGSIYYHFSSREEVIDEVLTLGLRGIAAGVGAILGNEAEFPDHGNRLAAGIRAHMLHLFARNAVISTNVRVYGQIPKGVSLRHIPDRRAYAAIWDRSLNQAKAAGALRTGLEVIPVRQLMLGALNWTVLWFDPEREKAENFKSLDEVIDVQRILFLEGIAARGGAITS
ncbi:MAG: TetR family transcriptional regulator [Sneathiella sp.]|uniref:TetR/AcrR family transcriptional regulator n=1 Tax=Sneathiella sp. TaxID=1964365 RepID=UPI000C620527|nr:TetR/AcrR family transcriptional regulator [Sneathiella sp.]MAZ01540.1 TetR family transcriptional regulator [Sneathiella sp.]